MAIRDLLVAYDGKDGADTAARLAVQMALKYDARVTGVYVSHGETYETTIRRWISKDVIAQIRAAAEQGRADAEQRFRSTIAETGYAGELEWIGLEGEPYVLLPRISRYFDLMLMGELASNDPSKGGEMHAENMLTRAGKPILVVPQSYRVRPFREHAVVAWDGSRSAARALTDAMQILETKKRLDVVHLGRDRTSWDPPAPSHDIIAHMARHGVNASRISLDPGGRSVGETLLAYTAETDPDILVMGAYGRGKFGGMLFGSLTRTVLQNLNVPTLLSH